MMISIKMKVSRMLKMTGNLTEIADRFKISRPTLYKYMELYDEGKTDQIPDEVLALFNDVVSDEENRIELRRKMENELMREKCEIDRIEHEITALMREREVLQARYCKCQELDSDEARMMSSQCMALEERIVHLRHDLHVWKEKMMELEKSFRTMVFEDYAEEANDGVYAIDTRCMYEKGKFMIAYNDPDSDGCEHILSLMTKFGNEYKTIGTYDTADGKDFFMIEDIIYSPYLFYSVNRVSTDPDGKKVIDKENSSKISKFKR